MRSGVPKDNPLRLRHVSVAARIGATAYGVPVALDSAGPVATLFRGIAMAFRPAGP
jgi:hypothetical protein